jgi:hypothetical protein
MNEVTRRGLDTSIKLFLTAPEFDRIRLFLIADASQGKGESEEIIKFVGDEIRAHLLQHVKSVAAAQLPK